VPERIVDDHVIAKDLLAPLLKLPVAMTFLGSLKFLALRVIVWVADQAGMP